MLSWSWLMVFFCKIWYVLKVLIICCCIYFDFRVIVNCIYKNGVVILVGDILEYVEEVKENVLGFFLSLVLLVFIVKDVWGVVIYCVRRGLWN